MLKNVSDITSEGKNTGLNTQDNILGIDKSQSPDMMNVRVHFDGSLEKRLGSNTQNSIIIANSAASSFSPAGSLTSGLQAFWKLDEAAGNRNDAFGGHTLIDNNSVGQSGGIRSKAALFLAADTEYLLHANTSTLATGDVNFSISTWFYLNSTSPTVERTIISKRDLAEDTDIVLLLHCDGADGSSALTNNSLSSHIFTSSGAVIDTDQSKFGGASARCENNYFFTPDASDLRLSSSSLTIDFWVRFTNTSGSQGVFGKSATGSQNSYYGYLPVSREFAFSLFPVSQVAVTLTSATLFIPNQWYHVACVRSSNDVLLFINGLLEASSSGVAFALDDDGGPFNLGAISANGASPMNGWVDEFRLVKGDAKFTTNFTVPNAPYSNPVNVSQFEYWLYVNTDNILTFEVSSSGVEQNGRVRATSFGALTTATWYNAIAYHDTADLIAVGINLSMNSSAYASGVRSGSAPFVIGAVSDGASAPFDGRVDETSFYKRVLNTQDRSDIYNGGSANTFQLAFDTKPWASFDFGASAIRWLTVAAGTGVYASSNLGVTWVNIATDRTANYQYLERSKNVLIATSDSYDTPLAWPGSSGTFMVMLNSNAPLTKYSINFQGFLILLNSQLRKRGFFYQDENTQLTGTWVSSFDIPSSQDDEITAPFILGKNLYVSTRYFLYRVSYVGGNPDFAFEKSKDWGYIPRTVKQIYVEGVGQIVAGLCWDGKTRFFDGSDDQIFSNDIEQNNELCDFALDKLSFSGSGPVISFAETDFNENVYKLCIAIGGDSTQTTHFINYDGRSKAFYPYSRQPFNTMVMAESANKRFLMAFDRSGYCHMMDSGNLDGNTTPIDDHYDSNLIFEKSPAQSQKGHQTNLFFNNSTAGRIYILDRTDFSNEYKTRESFVISGSDRIFQVHKVVDTPESYNVYQWRITSSSGTSDPWKLLRYDHMLKGQGIGKQ